MTRPTNQELCDEFRKLLTEGAELAMRDLAKKHPLSVGAALLDTRPWRGELWAKFAEIERRLCPQPPER